MIRNKEQLVIFNKLIANYNEVLQELIDKKEYWEKSKNLYGVSKFKKVIRDVKDDIKWLKGEIKDIEKIIKKEI